MKTAIRLSAVLTVAVALLAGALVRGAEDDKAIKPFNGKSLDGWKLKGAAERSHWAAGDATLEASNPGQIKYADGGDQLVNKKGGGVDIYCEKKFGDCTIEVEVMVPKGSNSGVYVMGEYEIQVFDSYGKEKLGGGDMGAIYGAQPARVNAQKKPGEWNKYVIVFKAPRFDAQGKKTANAVFVNVSLNGQTIHENVQMKGPTPGGVTGKEHAEGPLMFQGDHGPVAYRNIRITPGK